ncbi:unnamed protein product [Arabidopsis lyrata]|nr:unnamed protein product [Arabidopsis lyrata]
MDNQEKLSPSKSRSLADRGGTTQDDYRSKTSPLVSLVSQRPKYSTLSSSTIYLPEELKVEILSRVSATSLARSQCVSKGWNALINDEKFTKKRFLLRSHATVIMLIENRVYLVNVNLHETHNNMVKTIDWLFGIRFHVKPGGFNQEEPIRDSITLLLAVGEIGDWFILRRNGRVMYVNGNAYWLATTRGYVDFLQSFDFSTERFTRVSLPVDRHSYHIFSLSVTREEQKLCLLTQDEPVGIPTAKGSSINVWMATKIESNGATSWIKFLSVNFANIHKPFCFHNGMNFLVDPENKVFVCPGKNGFSKTFLNILGENKSIQVEHQDAESVCSLLVNYVPTLVQIQQGSLKKILPKGWMLLGGGCGGVVGREGLWILLMLGGGGGMGRKGSWVLLSGGGGIGRDLS